MQKLNGVIFDMDGTLLDSMGMWRSLDRRFLLENGVERIVKGMMMLLFALMIVLAVNSLLLPDAMKGLSFYLVRLQNLFP